MPWRKCERVVVPLEVGLGSGIGCEGFLVAQYRVVAGAMFYVVCAEGLRMVIRADVSCFGGGDGVSAIGINAAASLSLYGH